MNVDFGLAIRNFVGPNETPDAGEILRYAERAEALGFESLWAWDHILLGVKPAFPILDSLSILTAIASRTNRIKLGTGILVLPLRNPVVVAKVLASLDHISKGRLILGVAAGWYAREFNAVGIPFKQRGRLFEQNLELLLRLWTEESVTFEANGLNLREAVLLPKPYQKPRPPVLIGGYVETVLRRVARMADGWLTYFYTPEGFIKSWTKIQAYAQEYGRDPKALTATNQLAIYVGPPKVEADAAMRQWLTTEWDVASWSDSTIEHAIRGTAEECVEQLRPHLEAGVHRIILIPYRYQSEQVELIAREVIPRLSA
ncbi:MAG: TIGR03619 family F420-dependent LLM class oxidoreductase [Deltaproteobacteria bacterium]|nr:TIGR03619 family F420-dependent LLM class oxidoreductase [Deltaproteobacteria bacterium]